MILKIKNVRFSFLFKIMNNNSYWGFPVSRSDSYIIVSNYYIKRHEKTESVTFIIKNDVVPGGRSGQLVRQYIHLKPSIYEVFLIRISKIAGHNAARAVFCHVQDTRRTQNQWIAVGFDPESMILIVKFGLSVLHATN